MNRSLREMVARLTEGGLAPAARREALTLLACEPPGVDSLMLLHMIAGSTNPPRVEVPHGTGDRPRRRRWTVPAALTRDPGEGFDGLNILEEFDGALGVLLWQSFRDVQLWGATPPEKRGVLFKDTAHQRRRAAADELNASPKLDVWLTVLSAVTRYPTTVSPRASAVACIELARFATENSKYRAALTFAQCAAAALPSSPVAAYEVGLAAVRADRLERGETWFRRSVALARRTREWEPYGEALLQIGIIVLERGHARRARSSFLRALRCGRRNGLRHIRAGAQWGLFRAAMRYGPVAEAEAYAQKSIKLFGPSPASLTVELDLAMLRIREGRQDAALQLLTKIIARDSTAPEYLSLALSFIARLAAARRDTAEYRRAWTEAAALTSEIPTPNLRGRVVIELVRAAQAACDHTRVGQAARICLGAEGRCDPASIAVVTEMLALDERSSLRAPE